LRATAAVGLAPAGRSGAISRQQDYLQIQIASVKHGGMWLPDSPKRPHSRINSKGIIGGMLVDEALLVLAILATAAMIFRMVAREGVFGWQMQNFVFQSRHPQTVAVLAFVFWAAWACTADM
jgi:hypothetical protein